MGSRVVGFRVPDDLAEELERVSDERGQTTAEFLRKLVDDALYPPKGEAKGELEDNESAPETLADVNESIERLVTVLNVTTDKMLKHDAALAELNNKYDSLKELSSKYDTIRDLVHDFGTSMTKMGNWSEAQWKNALSILTTVNADNDKRFGKLEDSLPARLTKLEADIQTLSKVAKLQDHMPSPEDFNALKRQVSLMHDMHTKSELDDGKHKTLFTS